jgi:hypothetical protein
MIMKKLFAGGKMKRSHFFMFNIYCLFFSVFLWSCGDGPGSPGSSGSEDTGIRITAVNIMSDSPDLDVYSSPTACDGGPEALLTRTDATMTILAEKLNPNSTFDPFPASVEECIITYKKSVEDPSSPVIESMTTYPNCTILSDLNTCSITLMDIERKIDFWSALINGVNLPAEYPTHYVAQCRCKYVNNFGESGHFQTEYDIWLADWLICEE